MITGVIGSDVPWLECPACNAVNMGHGPWRCRDEALYNAVTLPGGGGGGGTGVVGVIVTLP